MQFRIWNGGGAAAGAQPLGGNGFRNLTDAVWGTLGVVPPGAIPTPENTLTFSQSDFAQFNAAPLNAPYTVTINSGVDMIVETLIADAGTGSTVTITSQNGEGISINSGTVSVVSATALILDVDVVSGNISHRSNGGTLVLAHTVTTTGDILVDSGSSSGGSAAQPMLNVSGTIQTRQASGFSTKRH